MEFLHTDMLVAEEEYRRLIFLNQEEVFGSNVTSEPIPFWLRLSSYSRQGDKPYEHLAAYALNCLLLPSSTASVERVFSQVTYIKNKYHNRMMLPLLDSLLRIKSYLQVRGSCCHQLNISQSMLEKFTAAMYGSKDEAKEEDTEEDIFLNNLTTELN